MPPRDSAIGEEDVAFVRGVSLLWILAAFIIGWIGIGHSPFWVDESIAVFPARGILSHGGPVAPYDLDFMPWQIKFDYWDPATPLYRYSLAAVFAFLGFSEVVARGFSWVVGFVALLPIYAAGRALFGRTTAWLGIALIAGSPTFGLFAREARHYTFVMLMGATLIWALLVAARPDAAPQRRMLWVLPLTAVLLTQTIGYVALPVAALYIAAVGPRRFVSGGRASLTVCAAALLVYTPVIAVFWNTLPFFHDLGCHNRPSGCQPHALYYLGTLHEFLAPMTERFGQQIPFSAQPGEWIVTVAAGPLLFVVGLAAAAFGSWQWPRRRAAMLWIWLLVPPLLLSTREVKFSRFLFQWTLPIALLISIYGLTQLTRLIRSPRLRRGVLVVAFAVLALAPQWREGRPAVPLPPSPRFVGQPVAIPRGWSSALLRYLRTQLWDAPDENWEFLVAKADYLRSRMQEGDTLVTSFDDAGLQYYTGRFAHGFLNSRHTDEFFLELLADAERRDRLVWFVDTLSPHNYCLSRDAEPRSVDCRDKYPRFYQTCLAADGALSHRCRRVTLPEVLHAPR